MPGENELLRNPPRFGSFGDETGDNGRPPSVAVLKCAFVALIEGREYCYHGQQQLVDGRNLADDESHKVVKAIRVNNEKVFNGVYTVINEYGQVVLQVRGTTFLCFSCSCFPVCNNVFVMLRVECTIESEEQSVSERIISGSKYPSTRPGIFSVVACH